MHELGLFRRPWAMPDVRTRFSKHPGQLCGHITWHSADHNGPAPFRGTFIVNGRITNFRDDPEARYKPISARWREHHGLGT